jgi:biotin-[acetyl-CoA-carboxylase] ligase BirA-like protein
MNSINQMTFNLLKNKNENTFFTESTASTNDTAKIDFPKLEKSSAIFLTNHQTHGRGRNQNEWNDLAKGEILLSTWSYKLKKNPQPILTPLLGLATYDALLKLDPNLPLRIKPPNDIYLNDGKLSGLLVEMTQMGSDFYLYIGLGLNVYASPNVDIKTSALIDNLNVTENQWSLFCTQLLENYKIAIEKSYDSKLIDSDRLKILKAINNNLKSEDQFTDLSAHCDLFKGSHKISWMDL